MLFDVIVVVLLNMTWTKIAAMQLLMTNFSGAREKFLRVLNNFAVVSITIMAPPQGFASR